MGITDWDAWMKERGIYIPTAEEAAEAKRRKLVKVNRILHEADKEEKIITSEEIVEKYKNHYSEETILNGIRTVIKDAETTIANWVDIMSTTASH